MISHSSARATYGPPGNFYPVHAGAVEFNNGRDDMVKNPPEGMPACCPYLLYDDLDAAVAFLAKAFGFEKRFAHAGPDGKIVHAQMGSGAAVVMLAGTKAPGALGPGRSPKAARRRTASVCLH